MARYLTKEQVIASFKLDYIPHLKDTPVSVKEDAWTIMLGSLCEDKKISEKQKNTWKFPKKELDL
jgi:hypothetical protein